MYAVDVSRHVICNIFKKLATTESLILSYLLRALQEKSERKLQKIFHKENECFLICCHLNNVITKQGVFVVSENPLFSCKMY